MERKYSVEDLETYRVALSGTIEQITQPMYDFQAYPTAGATVFTFFQNPIGQDSKTLSDTNMLSAGQMPKGQAFLVEGIEVNLLPSSADVDDATALFEEYYNVLTARASFEMQIGSKVYAQVAPLYKLMPRQQVNAVLAAGGTNEASFGHIVGEPFDIEPLTLDSSMNFSATIKFETAQTVSTAGRIGVSLNGTLFRNAQ